MSSKDWRLNFLHSTVPSHNQGTFYHPLQPFADGLEQLVIYREDLNGHKSRPIAGRKHSVWTTRHADNESPKVSPARQGPHLELPYGKSCMTGLLRSVLWPPVKSVSSRSWVWRASTWVVSDRRLGGVPKTNNYIHCPGGLAIPIGTGNKIGFHGIRNLPQIWLGSGFMLYRRSQAYLNW